MLLDTSVWIEFFKGSMIGEKVWEVLRSHGCYTSVASLAEVTSWCIKNNKDATTAVGRIKKMSKVLPLTEEIAQIAGKIHTNRRKIVSKWGMIDAMVYATARFYSQQVLTKDVQFEGLENAIVLDNL